MVKKKVLVVEDDYAIAKGIETFLSSEGYDIKMATNGSEAMEFIETETFDLITLDVRMPGLNGGDVLRLIKGGVSKKPKIIYITVSPKEELNMEGVEDYIQKPFDNSDLLAKVKRIIG